MRRITFGCLFVLLCSLNNLVEAHFKKTYHFDISEIINKQREEIRRKREDNIATEGIVVATKGDINTTIMSNICADPEGKMKSVTVVISDVLYAIEKNPEFLEFYLNNKIVGSFIAGVTDENGEDTGQIGDGVEFSQGTYQNAFKIVFTSHSGGSTDDNFGVKIFDIEIAVLNGNPETDVFCDNEFTLCLDNDMTNCQKITLEEVDLSKEGNKV